MKTRQVNSVSGHVGSVFGTSDGARLLLSGVLIVVASAWCAHAEAKDKAAGLVTTAPNNPALQWGPCPPIFAKGCEVAVLSGNPAKGASDVFLRTPPNFDLPPHFHHSPEHVVLVQGKFSVTFEGGRRAEVSQGAYTLIPGGVPHSARCEEGDPCVIFIGFEKPVDAMLKGAKTAVK